MTLLKKSCFLKNTQIVDTRGCSVLPSSVVRPLVLLQRPANAISQRITFRPWRISKIPRRRRQSSEVGDTGAPPHAYGLCLRRRFLASIVAADACDKKYMRSTPTTATFTYLYPEDAMKEVDEERSMANSARHDTAERNDLGLR